MNKCDLEETKKVALEKFLSLVYDEKERDNWEKRGMIIEGTFQHKQSGFKLTRSSMYLQSVGVFLREDYIGGMCYYPPAGTVEDSIAFFKSDYYKAYEHLRDIIQERMDQQKCNRIVENLNNPTKKKEDEKTCNRILDNLNKKEKPSWFSRMASVFGRN